MTAIKTIQFPTFENGNGVLGVYEGKDRIPFDIKRVFTISANAKDIRGEHAHKHCTQLLVCVAGAIRVDCYDGLKFSEYQLKDKSKGLLIPPKIWARQEYLTDKAVLMVLCDRGYEADDYIRDFEEFKSNHC